MARVLVVDDDADLRETVAEALRDAGWQVDLAEDGERALGLLSRRAPDVVLLDVLMPRWSGRDFVDGLRRLHHDVPVVVFTAGRQTREIAEQLGTPYFIEKPFEVPDLLHVLERATRK
jgi:DNA-binding response OmpR family regulator